MRKEATFKYYNIEVLPIETGTKEIGAEGYRKFITEYKNVVQQSIASKILHKRASPLRDDYLFSGFQILIRNDFAYGTFIRFHHSESLVDIYNNEVAMEISPNLSAKRYSYEFCFDYENHILAIQDKRLPTYKPLIEALELQLTPIVMEMYPGHSLSINELTTDQSLDVVFNADAYRTVHVEVSFSNSDEVEVEIERELREAGAGKSTLTETAPKSKMMNKLTSIAKSYLNLAKAHGDAKVTYWKDEKLNTYQMRDKPVKNKVKKSKDDDDESYLINTFLSIRNARSRTRPESDSNENS